MRDKSCQWPQIEKLRLPLKKQGQVSQAALRSRYTINQCAR